MRNFKKMMFILMIAMNIIAAQITEKTALSFMAFDCRRPLSLNSYRKSEWCTAKSNKINNQMGDNKEKTIILTHFLEVEKLKAIKCEKLTSSFTLYC